MYMYITLYAYRWNYIQLSIGLWINWFPRLRFCERCRNLDFKLPERSILTLYSARTSNVRACVCLRARVYIRICVYVCVRACFRTCECGSAAVFIYSSYFSSSIGTAGNISYNKVMRVVLDSVNILWLLPQYLSVCMHYIIIIILYGGIGCLQYVYTNVFLSACLFVCSLLSVCNRVFVCMPVFLSVYPSARPIVHLSVCLSYNLPDQSPCNLNAGMHADGINRCMPDIVRPFINSCSRYFALTLLRTSVV